MPPSNTDAGSATCHTYLRVRPTTDSLAGDRVTEQCEQLHAAVDTIIECLLVNDPAADELRYYLGSPPDTRPVLERVLARLVPDTYAIEQVDTDPIAELLDDSPNADEDTDTDADVDAPANLTAVTFHGSGERHDDWQTRLRPPATSNAPEQHQTARMEDAPGLPLASLVEGLRTADGPAVYQALIRPKDDWGWQAERRINDLEARRDTLVQRIMRALFGPPTDNQATNGGTTTTPEGSGSRPGSRIEAIRAKSQTHSFAVNARLVAAGPDAPATARDLASAFEAVGGDYYRLVPEVHDNRNAGDCLAAVRERRFKAGDGLAERFRLRYIPGANHSPRIVADATTLPHFCLFDGATLSESARTALRALRTERTGLPAPDAATLATYDEGLPLGQVVGLDGQVTDTTVALPPDLQPLHVAWFGKTGSGKSVALTRAITANHQVTEGADIAILPKGGDMVTTLLRSHYAAHGDLEDVYYFDCRDVVPALPFFDIREDLASGVSPTTAVQNCVDHYLELLRAMTGAEKFDSAIRSPDVIQYLVKALFDSEYGADAFTQRDLQEAVRQFRTQKEPPLVSDPDLRSMLAGVGANDDQSFDRIMKGIDSRIEKVTNDDRVARMFNHIPDDDDPYLDLSAVIDEDALVVIDMGGIRAESQSGLTLVVLSQLWTALRARTRRCDDADLPLVNLYLEEAADLAVTDLLSELLAQSREFGLAVTLAMQFPGQLRETDPEAYAELMNNVSTLVTGNVGVDTRLQQRLATTEMPPDAVGNRLRALSRGKWLVSLPAPFDEPEPRPFTVASLPLPAGHPEAPDFSDAREAAYDAEYNACVERTAREAGLLVDVERGPDAPPDANKPATPARDVDSALPYTDRLPAAVTYDPAAHALVCAHCGARYEATVDGIRRGVDCCADGERLDRDDVPICDVPLTLSEGERLDVHYTHQELLFLQAVYAAQQGRFDRLAYDLCHDGMDQLRDDCGLAEAAVQDLVDDGLLRHDTDWPHTLYTVTPAGRDLLREPHREGDAYGHETGDVAESALHTLLVTLAAAYIEQQYVASETPVVEVRRYYEPSDRDVRYDAVGLGADGEIRVAAEAERPNNDRFDAVPADYDKICAADPDAAIWVTRSQTEAHGVLQALNEPADGPPRVGKSYSESSPPSGWQIDAPGFTDIQTAGMLLRDLDFT